MPLIDLVRHGETSPPGLLLGRTDNPLSQEGWEQFERQTGGQTWPLIVSSPLRRSREAAERLAETSGTALRIDEDWAELDFGAWDGRPLAELRADEEISSRLEAFYRSETAPAPPGGESWLDLRTRVSRALERLSNSPDASTSADTSTMAPDALIVTHAGAIRAALSLACGLPFADLWTLRIGHGTRLSLRFGKTTDDAFWGEIVELVQPPKSPQP